MNESASKTTTQELRDLTTVGPGLFKLGIAMAVIGLGIAIALAAMGGSGGAAEAGDHGEQAAHAFSSWHQLGLSYLTGYMAVLSLTIGALFFLIINHLARAGWSVVIRRIAEMFASNALLMFALSLPILFNLQTLYPHWAEPAHAEALGHKTAFLNPIFFTCRVVFYFAVWIAIARWYLKHSRAQDASGDRCHTEILQRYSGGALILFALTTSFASWDLVMSLDPHWYSTIFGIYYFGASVMSFYCMMVLTTRYFQSKNILSNSITPEHYHDMGKWMFGFVIFWSYIAYSQYMLIWYAAIPEETAWMLRRGATTSTSDPAGPWGTVSVILLFGHFVIPFLGLVSRWAKRWVKVLTFWAVWLTIFNFVDMFWLIMPELNDGGAHIGSSFIMSLCCWIGILGLWIAGAVKLAGASSIVPTNDPRFENSLAFENQ